MDKAEKLYLKATRLIDEQEFDAAENNLILAHKINDYESKIVDLLVKVLRTQKKNDRAIEILEKVISKYPMRHDLRFIHALNFFEIGYYQKARASFLKIIEQSKDETINISAGINIANCYRREGSVELAIAHYKSLIERIGVRHDILYNLANCYDDLNDLENAKIYYEKCLSIKPQDIDCLYNLAQAHINVGRYEDALKIVNGSIARLGNVPSLKLQQSLIQLTVGNFRDGWENYKYRWKDPQFIKNEAKKYSNLKTSFSDIREEKELKDKKILLLSEQGLGDTIMFTSLLNEIKKVSEKITVGVDKRLLDLFRSSFQNIKFIDNKLISEINIRAFDVIMPLANLALLYRNKKEEFESDQYLCPKKQTIEYFKKQLDKYHGNFLVGISWRGGLIGTRSFHRSVNPINFIKSIQQENVVFIDLQHQSELNLNEAKSIILKPNDIIQFPENDLFDIEMLAGLIHNLDLVVTVQNTNVHVAGSIEKKCLALLPFAPEWRYGHKGNTMPWYKSVELIRQKEIGNWDSVFEASKQTISQLKNSKLYVRNENE